MFISSDHKKLDVQLAFPAILHHSFFYWKNGWYDAIEMADF